jgi:ubiquitin carboxyl-terminal hydrolase 8
MNIQKLQSELRAREKASISATNDIQNGQGSSTYSNGWQEKNVLPMFPRSSSPDRPSFNPTPSFSNSNLKIPRKRPIVSSSSDKGSAAISNGLPSRPSSTSSSAKGSTRDSDSRQSPQLRESQHKPEANRPSRQGIIFPKANVIEPQLLLSYLTQPPSSRPTILLLDLRPKELYETGCLNADNVVWIDPILLDQEYVPLYEKLILSESLEKILKSLWFCVL